MTQSNIQANVKKILEKYPATREDDRVLIQGYMSEYHNEALDYPLRIVFSRMLLGVIPRFDTLTRYSRALQAKHPELEGTNIAERKAKQVKVKQDLAERFILLLSGK